MHKHTSRQIVYYQFEAFAEQPRMVHGVFTRKGGVSEGAFDSLNVGSTVGDDQERVLTNRQRLAETFSMDDANTRTTWQVHGADVVRAMPGVKSDAPPPKADGIITNDSTLPLVMRFADCVPILLYDPIHHAIGLAHAGWRGTVAGAGEAVVRAMADAYGSQPKKLIAGIGPSIGPCCYEVGPEVVQGIAETFGSTDDLLHQPEGNGTRPHLDLWAANERALHDAGVQHIEVAHLCTSCNTHEFYSHRKEQGNTGRFGVLISLRSE
jgi:hypothetical protein